MQMLIMLRNILGDKK
uniref:Uncharacterized protein n=1 Tax=Rhizophora mucronata TaxID=61149 RepID=A0A2P2P2U2_RHIMU